ncbi:MAG: indolepyruvate oxidoreductase subunit beta [Deltaproteobacteria bacterium]|nr:MAG: indolepyruvate oxidoreductase subunit beta [Deltaproteobacteria bacterium]
MKTINILLAGVGGQGVLLASKILSEAALVQGLDIKQSEVHGMSQRGGSVVSHVRIGDKVHSPLVPDGSCDILVGFEPLEGLRHSHNVAADGTLIYALDRINPSTVSAGFAEYPADTEEQLKALPIKTIGVPAAKYAEEAGTRRAANVVLVGVMSNLFDFKTDVWEKALKASVPAKVLDTNIKAFELGKKHI